MALYFLPWAKSTQTLIPNDFYSMSFAKHWTKTNPTGERPPYASWTTPPTTETPWLRSTSKSWGCRWFLRQSMLTVPLLANSFSHTSRETLSMNMTPQQERSKYFYFIILPRSFENVVEGVNERMKKMKPSSFVRFWKHAVLGQFKYICLETVWGKLSYLFIRRYLN